MYEPVCLWCDDYGCGQCGLGKHRRLGRRPKVHPDTAQLVALKAVVRGIVGVLRRSASVLEKSLEEEGE